jgi:hypothetical protein
VVVWTSAATFDQGTKKGGVCSTYNSVVSQNQNRAVCHHQNL